VRNLSKTRLAKFALYDTCCGWRIWFILRTLRS